jgi:hypothetical protein
MIVGWASSVFIIACSALLCGFVFKLSMCLLVQIESRWWHVAFSWDAHRLYVGDIFS